MYEEKQYDIDKQAYYAKRKFQWAIFSAVYYFLATSLVTVLVWSTFNPEIQGMGNKRLKLKSNYLEFLKFWFYNL